MLCPNAFLSTEKKDRQKHNKDKANPLHDKIICHCEASVNACPEGGDFQYSLEKVRSVTEKSLEKVQASVKKPPDRGGDDLTDWKINNP